MINNFVLLYVYMFKFVFNNIYLYIFKNNGRMCFCYIVVDVICIIF